MKRHRVIAFAPVTAAVTMTASADAAPPGYHEAMIKAGGQADGPGVVCGKATPAQAKAHKAELRTMYAAKGIAPAKFATIYGGGYASMTAQAKSNPVQVRQACARLAREAGSAGRS